MDEKLTIWAPQAQKEEPRHYDRLNRQGLDAGRFWKQNKEIVLRFMVLLIVILSACLITKVRVTKKLKADFAVQLTAARIQVEQETMARLREEYNVTYHEEQKSQMEIEATALAKMLYPMQYNTDEGLRSACWCVFNRVESSLYPSTVEMVCAQKSQFMGWDERNPVIQRLYDIALAEVKAWHNGVHPMDVGFLYLEWNTKEITLRTTYEGGRGCHYWYESDWN